jgi:hypothetical protein
MARSWRTPAVLLLAAAALQGACADFSAADALFRHASAAALAAASSTGAAAATHGSERAAAVRVIQAKLRGVRQEAEAPPVTQQELDATTTVLYASGGAAPSEDDSGSPMDACFQTIPCYVQIMAAFNDTAVMNITNVTNCPMSASAVNACYGVRPHPRSFRHPPSRTAPVVAVSLTAA